MTLDKLYQECSRTIGDASDTPALDGRIIIQDALGLDSASFILQGPHEVQPLDAQRILEMARRRREGTPVAYITGHRGFFMDDFLVNESTLIPRTDTEILVEHAIAKSQLIIQHKADIFEHDPTNRPSFRILDLCCGTGCIGISVAKELSNWLLEHGGNCHAESVPVEPMPMESMHETPIHKKPMHETPRPVELTLSDISKDAIEVCRRNASKILEGPSHGCKVCWNVVVGDLFSTVGDMRFDLIATNPPYIRRDAIPSLDAQIQSEPILALDGGADGLAVIERIVESAPQHMTPGGWMLMEIGFDQGDAVKKLFSGAGFVHVSVEKDLGGRDRVVIGRVSK